MCCYVCESRAKLYETKKLQNDFFFIALKIIHHDSSPFSFYCTVCIIGQLNNRKLALGTAAVGSMGTAVGSSTGTVVRTAGNPSACSRTGWCTGPAVVGRIVAGRRSGTAHAGTAGSTRAPCTNLRPLRLSPAASRSCSSYPSWCPLQRGRIRPAGPGCRCHHRRGFVVGSRPVVAAAGVGGICSMLGIL